jgi:hypothetical protein
MAKHMGVGPVAPVWMLPVCTARSRKEGLAAEKELQSAWQFHLNTPWVSRSINEEEERPQKPKRERRRLVKRLRNRTIEDLHQKSTRLKRDSILRQEYKKSKVKLDETGEASAGMIRLLKTCHFGRGRKSLARGLKALYDFKSEHKFQTCYILSRAVLPSNEMKVVHKHMKKKARSCAWHLPITSATVRLPWNGRMSDGSATAARMLIKRILTDAAFKLDFDPYLLCGRRHAKTVGPKIKVTFVKTKSVLGLLRNTPKLNKSDWSGSFACKCDDKRFRTWPKKLGPGGRMHVCCSAKDIP